MLLSHRAVSRLGKRPTAVSFGLVPLILAPLDHGSVLRRGINDVVMSTGTVRIAEPLGVPGQTHWHGRIHLGPGKWANGAISNLLTQSRGLDGSGLVGAKERNVEMSVVQSSVGGLGLTRTTSRGATTSASAKRGATGEGRHVGCRRTIVFGGTQMKTDKGAKAILVPESQGQVWLPLLLNLDLVDNIQGVRAGNGTLRTIEGP
jgi:hypothetical protein